MRRNKAFKLETDNRVDVVKSVCRVKVSISFLSFNMTLGYIGHVHLPVSSQL